MKRLRWQAEWGWMAAVLVLLVLCYSWIPGAERAGLDTFSTSAGGKRAFFTVMEQMLPPVSRELDDIIAAAERADTICILGPARYPDSKEWSFLHGWVSMGNSLVFAARQSDPAVELKYFGIRVLPNARLMENKHGGQKGEGSNKPSSDADDERSEVKKGDARPESGGTAPARKARRSPFPFAEPVLETSLASGEFHWQTSGYVQDSGIDSEVLVSFDGQPQVIRKSLGAGTVIVCSSDYIFSNKSLATDDNGLLAFRIVEATAPRNLVFDETLNSSGAPKVLGLLFEPQVRPITLQILIVTVLFGWWGYRQFGSALKVTDSEHRSMTEHAAALGNLHWKSGTGSRALASYLEYLRNELRLHYVTGPAGMEATQLARRAGIDDAVAAKLLADARQLIQQERAPGNRVAFLVREFALIKNKLDHAKGN